MFKSNRVCWVFIGLVFGALMTLTFQLGAMEKNSTKAAMHKQQNLSLPLEELQRLALVFGLLKENYVENIDEKKIIDDAVAGMVSGLDPHSQYMTAKEYKEFRDGVGGNFVGLGIEVNKDSLGIKVVSPIEGSPASKAGILAGDVITKIDGESARELSLIEAVNKMRGKENTKIRITIYRKNENRSFDLELIRKPINVKSVKSKFIDDRYLWLRLTNFQENSLVEFAEHLTKASEKNNNIKGIVLDLRNNPGGLLYDAVGVCAVFLPKDVLVVSTKGRQKATNIEYFARPQEYTPYMPGRKDPMANLPAWLKKVPLVVLVNEGSASASEIVAGALRDHKRAIIMGSTTFGKGSVQNVQPLPGGAALKLTIARYYTPNGISIQAKGIKPDVLVDDFAEGSPYALLQVRESDLSKHLTSENEETKLAREQRQKQREELLKKIEQDSKENKLLKYPELGSAEDFPLQQALNLLKGLPVKKAKDKAELLANKK